MGPKKRHQPFEVVAWHGITEEKGSNILYEPAPTGGPAVLNGIAGFPFVQKADKPARKPSRAQNVPTPKVVGIVHEGSRETCRA